MLASAPIVAFAATTNAAAARGVTFERFPGMDQDELGVWRQAVVAWFKDPDGNLLSISKHEQVRA